MAVDFLDKEYSEFILDRSSKTIPEICKEFQITFQREIDTSTVARVLGEEYNHSSPELGRKNGRHGGYRNGISKEDFLKLYHLAEGNTLHLKGFLESVLEQEVSIKDIGAKCRSYKLRFHPPIMPIAQKTFDSLDLKEHGVGLKTSQTWLKNNTYFKP